MPSSPSDVFARVVHHPDSIPTFDFTNEYDPVAVAKRGWGIGGYDEHRVQSMYDNADLYDEARCIHMGVDIWGPAGTPVHAFTAGTIYAVRHHDSPRNYGPTVITQHEIDGETIWALHGHLSEATLSHVASGQRIAPGAVLGWFGDKNENGGWPPHLHFQLSREEPTHGDMPGVVALHERKSALKTFPDPRLVLGDVY